MISQSCADTSLYPAFGGTQQAGTTTMRRLAESRRFLAAEAAFDGLAAFASAGTARFLLAPNTVSGLQHAFEGATIFAVLFVLTLYALKGYSSFSSLLQIRETERTLKAATLATLLGIVCLLYMHQPVSLRASLLTLALASAFVTGERQLLGKHLRTLHERRVGSLRVMIYGNTVTGRRVYDLLSRSPRLGLKPTTMVDRRVPEPTRLYASAYRHRESIQVLPGPIDREFLERHGADLILIDPEVCSGADVDHLRRAARETNASIAFLPSKHSEHQGQAHYVECDGILLALPCEDPGAVFYETLKRVFDIAFAAVALVLFLPVLLVAAIAIKQESAGPVFFTQIRIGRHGKPFSILKLRTMYSKMCGDALSPKKQGDPRITRVGHWLRKSSLDELPQLVNVLRGEMSLVGPRPEMKMIVDAYTPSQRRRLAVTPGITGLWQISADRGFQIHERIEYDLYYIEHRNMFLDLAVMLHTAIFAVRGI